MKGRPLAGHTEVKKKIFVCAVITAVLACFTVAVGALPKLSTALDVLAAQNKMTVSAAKGESINFSEELFAASLGTAPYQIKLTSLPSSEDGTLIVGNSAAFSGQTVSRANLSLLHFEATPECTDTSFEFTADGDCVTSCRIRFTEGANSAPVCTASACVTTQTDIAAYGTLHAVDRDGDRFTFEITSYPSHGILNLSSDGTYCYTPYEGVTGNDSFSYRACDEYGNYSEDVLLEVNIEKRATEAVLCDMDGHRAHSAALSAIADGSMDVISEAGQLYFDPDDKMTRDEFLRTVMISLGAPTLADCDTPFADNDEISSGCSGYVAAAYRLGIVNGESDGESIFFRPHDVISCAEGAVILNRILGASSAGAVETFADTDNVPTWAADDIKALGQLGILDENEISPTSNLTRSQTAQLLYSAKAIYK